MTPSSRIVLAKLPGTVLDVARVARIPEPTVRARIAELQRAGLVRIVGRKASRATGACGFWCVYAANA